jgi:hypothetical protein
MRDEIAEPFKLETAWSILSPDSSRQSVHNLGPNLSGMMKVILPLLLCLRRAAPVGANRSSAAQPVLEEKELILAGGRKD